MSIWLSSLGWGSGLWIGGIRRILVDVTKLMYIRNGSIMLTLAMLRQNGCILPVVFSKLRLWISLIMSSVLSGSFGNASGPWTTSSCWVLVLVKDWWSSGVLRLTASRSRTSSL
jgi:hypothetical protein